MPAVQASRESARRLQCQNNLKQIGIGCQNFASAYDGQFADNTTLFLNPAATAWPFYGLTTPYGSWSTEILPYLEQNNVTAQYNSKVDWWDSTNTTVALYQNAMYVCPSAPHPDRVMKTTNTTGTTFNARAADYVGVGGMYDSSNTQANYHPGVMQAKVSATRTRFADVTDGLSNTLCVVEIADKPNVWHGRGLFTDNSNTVYTTVGGVAGQWAAPNWNDLRGYSYDGTVAFGPCAVNCSNSASIYGFHPGGANVLLCDGSVQFLKVGINRDIVIRLVSTQEGEILGQY
jgi:prepilin-type processing-associated H-X9-DG protein